MHRALRRIVAGLGAILGLLIIFAIGILSRNPAARPGTLARWIRSVTQRGGPSTLHSAVINKISTSPWIPTEDDIPVAATIRGRLIDSKGRPVNNAIITTRIENALGIHTLGTTLPFADGTFIARRGSALEIRAKGLATCMIDGFESQSIAPENIGNIQIPEAIPIQLFVRDSSGSPIVHARVSLQFDRGDRDETTIDFSEADGFTGPDGSCKLNNLGPGSYYLFITAGGFRRDATTLSLESGDTPNPVYRILEKSNAGSLLVTDAGGLPLPGAKAWLSMRLLFKNLPRGDFMKFFDGSQRSDDSGRIPLNNINQQDSLLLYKRAYEFVGLELDFLSSAISKAITRIGEHSYTFDKSARKCPTEIQQSDQIYIQWLDENRRIQWSRLDNDKVTISSEGKLVLKDPEFTPWRIHAHLCGACFQGGFEVDWGWQHDVSSPSVNFTKLHAALDYGVPQSWKIIYSNGIPAPGTVIAADPGAAENPLDWNRSKINNPALIARSDSAGMINSDASAPPLCAAFPASITAVGPAGAALTPVRPDSGGKIIINRYEDMSLVQGIVTIRGGRAGRPVLVQLRHGPGGSLLYSTFSDSSGYFHFPPSVPGTTWININISALAPSAYYDISSANLHNSGSNDSGGFETASGQCTTVQLDIPDAYPTLIRGIVTFNGKPMGGARVVAISDLATDRLHPFHLDNLNSYELYSARALTADDGSFAISCLTGGTVNLAALSFYGRTSSEFMVPDSGALPCNIEIKRSKPSPSGAK